MSKKQTRTCCVCHKEYSFCPVCNSEDRNKPTWYFAYCGENCRDIYKVTSDYEGGRIKADEAKLELDKLNLIDLRTFGESYQKTITKINKEVSSLKEEKQNKETVEKPVEKNKDYKKPRTKKVLNVGEVE